MRETAEHYSTDSEGGRPVCRRFAISGRFAAPAYLAFIAERAQWLSIDGWAGGDAGGITLVAAGPEALVGALEMACTLGPQAALVDSIVGEDVVLAVPRGFRLVQK